MANLINIQQPAPRFNDNLLPINYSLDILSGGSNVEVTLDDTFGFDKEKSIKLRSLIASNDVVFNLQDYSVTIPKDGDYAFSFRAFKEDTDTAWVLNVKIFINGILTYTSILSAYDLDGFLINEWNTYGQSYAFSSGDVVTFRIEANCDTSLDVMYLSAFKLELLDKGFGVPSIYSYPKDKYLENNPDFVFVSDLTDLPSAVAGVITLEADKTYYFVNTLDLNGNRLVGGSNTVLLGASSENSILTSTGLGVGVALFTSIYTTPIRHISFKDVDTAINFDGTSNPNEIALDLTGVNFVNVPNVGSVTKASNFIFDKGAFLNSKGLSFDGEIGTIGFGNCLFSGDGLAGDILKIESTCTITRRFRIIYSSIIAFGSTVGVNIDVSATIPNESYILDTINFSGGGTYLAGVTVTDNKTLFEKCKGISNTVEVSQYYMNGNATATTIASAGVAVKASGTTTSASVTQKFTNTDNRATYVGSFTRFFKVTAVMSFTSGSNDVIGCYITKNGVIIPESEIYQQTDANGSFQSNSIQALVELNTNDYIEIFVENSSSATNITVTDLNVIIQ